MSTHVTLERMRKPPLSTKEEAKAPAGERRSQEEGGSASRPLPGPSRKPGRHRDHGYGSWFLIFTFCKPHYQEFLQV